MRGVLSVDSMEKINHGWKNCIPAFKISQWTGSHPRTVRMIYKFFRINLAEAERMSLRTGERSEIDDEAVQRALGMGWNKRKVAEWFGVSESAIKRSVQRWRKMQPSCKISIRR